MIFIILKIYYTQVLIYAGDVDYICNWLGNKKWVKALEWDGKEEFNLAEDKPWNLTKGKIGPIWPYLALQGISTLSVQSKSVTVM